MEKYHICTNTNMRRILVIDDIVDIDSHDELQFEDFDAIFINVINPVMNRNKLAINLASPLQSEKCRFKPCFATELLNGWLGDLGCVVDGYATDPNDTVVTQTIEQIYSNMQRIQFLLGTEPVVTHTEEILRLCRFAISRQKYAFSNLPTVGIYEGFMELYYHTIWNPIHEKTLGREREFFQNQLLKLGYITKKRFIDRLHFCPKCNSSHLFFFETCPKCGSSDVSQEDVIHHFRCANVAPASAYDYDGELRCPKCKKELRHIGVDYDKPSRIYTCKECASSFMYPDMRVQCASCRSTMTTDELVPVDAIEYEFTPDGIRAFANYDIIFTINRTGFFGHGTMEDFENFICKAYGETIVVSRYHIYDPEVMIPGLSVYPSIVKSFTRLFDYKSALVGSDFFFLAVSAPGEVVSTLNKMELELNSEFKKYADGNPGFRYQLAETLTLHDGEDPERFISRMKERVS